MAFLLAPISLGKWALLNYLDNVLCCVNLVLELTYLLDRVFVRQEHGPDLVQYSILVGPFSFQ